MCLFFSDPEPPIINILYELSKTRGRFGICFFYVFLCNLIIIIFVLFCYIVTFNLFFFTFYSFAHSIRMFLLNRLIAFFITKCNLVNFFSNTFCFLLLNLCSDFSINDTIDFNQHCTVNSIIL